MFLVLWSDFLFQLRVATILLNVEPRAFLSSQRLPDRYVEDWRKLSHWDEIKKCTANIIKSYPLIYSWRVQTFCFIANTHILQA